MKAVKQGSHDMLAQPSNHFISNGPVGPQDVHDVKLNDSTEEGLADGICNANTPMLQQRGCENGYCVACLSGDYPIALDW